MSLKEILNQASQFQNNAGSTGLDLSSMPIKLQQTLTFEIADDFNDGIKDSRWLLETPNDQPTESGGFLQFAYPGENPTSNEAIFNSVRGSVELETRFILETIASNILPYSDYFVPFGVAILSGAINPPHLNDADRENRMIWECWINWSPFTNFLALLVFCYGTDDVKYFWMNSSSQWVQDPGPAGRQGIFLSNPANIPITLKCENSGQGIIIKAYKNDDPSQIIFQTGTSPARRQLDNYHLNLAHAANFGGGRTKYDYFKLSGDIIEPDSGEVLFRRSYPIKTKLTKYRMDRILPAPSSKINFKIRTADTLDALQAAIFSEPMVKSVDGNVETGYLNLPAGLFFDIKLEFIKGSPSPLLNSFDFTTIPQAVDNDQPIILSPDEAGPGLVMATSSEEGTNETENTKKLIDNDANTQWLSLNDSDSTSVTLSIKFLTPSGGTDIRTINAVILRNTNIKALRVYAYLGGEPNLFDGEILHDDVIIPFSPLQTAGIKIEAKTTKIPNQNKKIGEIYCGQILVVLPNFDSYEPQRELIESGNIRMLGGKLVAYRGKNKYTSRWKIILVDSDVKDVVEQIFKQNPLVTFWPEPKSKPRDLFDIGWKMESLPFAYSDVLKTAGYTIEAEMTEI